MPNRDEFLGSVVDPLAKRVGVRCSNPSCRISTAGPREDPTKSINIGVAAHITAAAEGGPRYDASLSAKERSSVKNGIWLCQNCAKLIDNDATRYSIQLLKTWKAWAEETARVELEGTTANGGRKSNVDLILDWRKLEIRSDRHEYELELSIHNVGTEVLREYHVDIEVPTPVLEDSSGRVGNRSDRDKSLFRKAWRSDEDDIFPEDRQVVISIPYFMDSRLFSHRGNLFDRIVRATFYQGGQLRVQIERRFGELQCF